MRKAIKTLWTAVKFAAVAVYGATLVVAAFVDLPVALVLAFPGLILVINLVARARGCERCWAEDRHLAIQQVEDPGIKNDPIYYSGGSQSLVFDTYR